ncbi:MAG: RNB domain-containing ribonuclease, partial [Chloroflexota bacterium]
MTHIDHHDRQILQEIAEHAMRERGLLPEFSSRVRAEVKRIDGPAQAGLEDTPNLRDLTGLMWCSIDNDDSRDLDQLTVAEALSKNDIRVRVAIADVDALVRPGSAIDEHARHNTVTVYTAAQIFPMLPEELSTGFTSLNYEQERLAVVVDMLIDDDGSLLESEIYPARVYNHARLAYNDVAAWLEGGRMPDELARVRGLPANLRLQDQAARRLKQYRSNQGALRLETVKARPVFAGDQIQDLDLDAKNRAKEIIEDFMIAANGITGGYLVSRGLPALRRVVRAPKRWERIVELARQYGTRLPGEPDSKALDEFLAARKAADPLRFPDLSLAVVKLLGPGEYVADLPGRQPVGHFGLAVKDYTHSTAPNRRYPDLATQRLLKAAVQGGPSPYTLSDLDELAQHCTRQEDAAAKVERQVDKSAAALLLQDRIGDRFNAIVTGAAAKGTWVRVLQPPVEGKLEQGYEGVDVGDRLQVELIDVDVRQGFIDFKKVERGGG